MSQVKAAVLGAGNCVMGPSLLKGAVIEHRLDGLELALVDPDGLALDLIACVGRRLARELGVNLRITTHARREAALDGADFVIFAADHERHRRFDTDCAIIDRLSPGHWISEFSGIAGISCSLRQIALIQEVGREMRRVCPDAWLFNLADPLSHVAQAAHEEGMRTVGFGSASLAGYGRIWQILHGEWLSYPFEPARSQLDVTMGGLNHFSWILQVYDSETGQNLYPSLCSKGGRTGLFGEPLARRMFTETGYLPALGDEQIQGFLPPGGAANRRSKFKDAADDRQRRTALLRDVAEERASWQDLLTCEVWEKPIDLLAAMMLGRARRFHALSLINHGQITALPPNVFVETPAVGTVMGPLAEKVVLPGPILPLCQRAALVTDTIVRAARQQSRSLLNEAIDLDPTIVDKSAAQSAIAACLEAHRDVLPAYP